MKMRQWVREALANHRPQPGEQIEIFALSREEQTWEWHEGQLENRESVRAFGAGVRIFSEGAVGFAYRADTRPHSMEAAVAEARSQLAHRQKDAFQGLPQPPAVIPNEAAEDLVIADEEKISWGRRLEQAALKADPRVKKIPQVLVRESREWVGLANSQGLEAAWPRTAYTLGVAALAAAGLETQLGEEYRAWRTSPEVTPEIIGRIAGERAAGMLGAQPIPTGRRSLLLPPHITAGILEAAWEAWSGDAVQRGRSFLAGQLGKTIAAKEIKIVDDGLWPGGLGTAPLDDEGVASQRTVLVEAGCLNGFLYDTESGRRAQVASTGNGKRQGFKGLPMVGPSNFVLLPGSDVPESWYLQAEGGLVVNEVMGLHTLDSVTGEFSLGASGRLIEKGGLGRAVRGVTIAGTLAGLLSQVAAVGQDLTFYGNFGAPSLLVNAMMVSGA